MPLDDRDTAGRFVKGWKGGPGNPHAAKVSKLRAALLGAVTVADVAAIARGLVKEAKRGDATAAKLVLSYLCGPAESMHQSADGDAIERILRDQLAQVEPQPGAEAAA